jgi:hypothetical protein
VHHYLRMDVSFLIGLLLAGCKESPPPDRPQGVLLDAVYVPGGKIGGWWQQCRHAGPAQAVHCRIWNGHGLLLEDDDFIPYDGGPPPTQNELKIESDSSTPQLITLTNKRILLPQSRYEELKDWLDWLNGRGRANGAHP